MVVSDSVLQGFKTPMASFPRYTSAKNDNLNVVRSRIFDFLKVLSKNNV